MTGWKLDACSDMMPTENAMVVTVPIEQAVAQLVDLVRELGPGDEIVLTDGGRRLARIVPEVPPRDGRRPGACKGMLEVLDNGDDAVLEHFKEYLP
jgi:antitoxin (DNA-binding transcriptional repressor) of toxin-antitoxin stability system